MHCLGLEFLPLCELHQLRQRQEIHQMTLVHMLNKQFQLIPPGSDGRRRITGHYNGLHILGHNPCTSALGFVP